MLAYMGMKIETELMRIAESVFRVAPPTFRKNGVSPFFMVCTQPPPNSPQREEWARARPEISLPLGGIKGG